MVTDKFLESGGGILGLHAKHPQFSQVPRLPCEDSLLQISPHIFSDAKVLETQTAIPEHCSCASAGILSLVDFEQ